MRNQIRMTTPASRRKTARAEYVHAAAKAKIAILAFTRKFPKRWYYDVTTDLVATARELHKITVRANAIYPASKREYDDKISLLNEAVGNIVYLETTIDELYKSDPYTMRTVKNKDGQEVQEKFFFITEKSVRHVVSELCEAEKLIEGLRRTQKKERKEKYPD